MSVLTEINKRKFLLIDTPGFGHPNMPNSKVANIIYNMVGYFTRQSGGVHGILYVHNIFIDRTAPGMRDSYKLF